MAGFKKAVKEQAKLRLAVIGPSGSGKTFSSLRIACEMARLMREAGQGNGRVGLIDTERESASLYANKFDFDAMPLDSHSPISYVDAITLAENEGIDILIVDSLSHAWMGKDGALEQVDKAVERGAGNSFSAWRTVTPKHNALVDKILSSKLHLIATIRAKTEYVQEKNDKGKTEIKKLGMAAIQRDGLEYEFTCVGDLDLQNNFKVSKTRLDGVVSPGEIFEKPGELFAQKVYGWLIDGAPKREPAPLAPAAPSPVAAAVSPLAAAIDEATDAFIKAIETAETREALDAAIRGPGKPAKGTPGYQRAADAYTMRDTWLKAQAAHGTASC